MTTSSDSTSNTSTESKNSSNESPGSRPPLLPQPIIDKGFQLQQQIGSGHYSQVFKASWTAKPGVVIACKRIEIQSVEEDWKDNCLKQEMIIMKQLKHPNIVKTYEFIKTRRLVFIFMEFADNGTIKDQLFRAKKPIKENIAKLWFSQLIGALHYMHNKGIAHRDLKTDNFLLNADWEAMLSDFGFATINADLTNDKLLKSTQCGTPVYMAPEVLNLREGLQYDAFSSDIYSMGVCLYEMINYDKPFDEKLAANMSKLIECQNRRKYRLHKKIEEMITTSLKDLIHKLLEPKPEYRIKAEQVVKHPALRLGSELNNINSN